MNGPVLLAVVEAAAAAIFPRGVEATPEPDSPCGREAAASQRGLEKHVLKELPRHGRMLSAACLDASTAVAHLDGDTPFGGSVLLRGLLEVAADLHWLFSGSITPVERARRAVCVYFRQTEATLQKMRDLARRQGDQSMFERAVTEGEAMLAEHANEAVECGHKVKRDRWGNYLIGAGKPTTTSLIDAVASAVYGDGQGGIYRRLSQIAHANGAGLAMLIDPRDTVQTPEGLKSRYGLDEAEWSARVVQPTAAITAFTLREFVAYAHPSRLAQFDHAITATMDHVSEA